MYASRTRHDNNNSSHFVTRKNKPREEISPRFDEIFRGMEKL